MANGFNLSTDDLLCMVVVDDEIQKAVLGRNYPHIAFCRGFIVRIRATGQIEARFRFRYPDGEDSWHRLTPKVPIVEDALATARRLETGLREVFTEACAMVGSDAQVHSFWIPDEGRDPDATLQFLIEKDLVEIKSVTKNGQEIKPHEA